MPGRWPRSSWKMAQTSSENINLGWPLTRIHNISGADCSPRNRSSRSTCKPSFAAQFHGRRSLDTKVVDDLQLLSQTSMKTFEATARLKRYSPRLLLPNLRLLLASSGCLDQRGNSFRETTPADQAFCEQLRAPHLLPADAWIKFKQSKAKGSRKKPEAARRQLQSIHRQNMARGLFWQVPFLKGLTICLSPGEIPGCGGRLIIRSDICFLQRLPSLSQCRNSLKMKEISPIMSLFIWKHASWLQPRLCTLVAVHSNIPRKPWSNVQLGMARHLLRHVAWQVVLCQGPDASSCLGEDAELLVDPA